MEWNEKYDEIQIEVRRADHPSDGKTHHDYLIFLSLDDLTKVIELAAGSGIPKCGRKMSRKLRRVRAELLKLLVCASGLALAQANNEPQKA